MAKVFAVNPVKHDLSSAERYGKIVYISRRYVYGDEIDESHRIPDVVRRVMADAVDRFDPKTDYLLLAGDQLQLAAMCAMLGRRYGCVRVLRYDKIAAGYFEVLLS